MTPDKLKLLFALAHPGKCWHDFYRTDLHLKLGRRVVTCRVCEEERDGNKTGFNTNNPTFTTFAEIEGVMEGLIREGLWDNFLKYYLFYRGRYTGTGLDFPALFIAHFDGLFSKDASGNLRFFDLVAECPEVLAWWEGR